MEDELDRNLDGNIPREDFMDSDTKAYLISIKQQLISKNEEEIDEEILVENVFSEIDEKMLRAMFDKKTSAVLETILPKANFDQMKQILQAVKGYSTQTITNRNGSHVIEVIIIEIAKNMKEKSNADYSDLLENFLSEIKINIDFILHHTIGSCVLKSLMYLLKGVTPPPKRSKPANKKQKKNQKKKTILDRVEILQQPQKKEFTVPKYFHFFYYEILNQISKLQLSSVIFNQSITRMVQAVLWLQKIKIKYEKQSKKIKEKELISNFLDQILLLKNEKEKAKLTEIDHLNAIVKDPIASHVFETILQICSDDLYSNLYHNFFRNYLEKLSQNEISQYSVQKLVFFCKSKPIARLIYDELEKQIPKLFESNRGFIVTKLIHLTEIQSTRRKALLKALNSFFITEKDKQNEFVEKIGEYQTNFGNSNHYDYSSIGSLVLQELLKYPSDKVKPLFDSILSIKTEKLINLAKGPFGSRVIESFLNSKVAPVLKKKLVKKYNNNYAELAKSQFGSRVVEKCYEVSSIVYKICWIFSAFFSKLSQDQTISSQLSDSRDILINSYFGLFVLNKCKANIKNEKNFEKENQKKIKNEKQDSEEETKKNSKIKKKENSEVKLENSKKNSKKNEKNGSIKKKFNMDNEKNDEIDDIFNQKKKTNKNSKKIQNKKRKMDEIEKNKKDKEVTEVDNGKKNKKQKTK